MCTAERTLRWGLDVLGRCHRGGIKGYVCKLPGFEIVGMAKRLFYAFRAWSDIQRFEPAALAVFYASAIVSLHLRLSELMFALIQFRLTFS